jgi:MoxR-like ATPase
MQPKNPQLPSINPRQLSKEELRELLIKSGYVPQETVLTDTMEMLSAELPILIEGKRGAGKTALAEYIAQVCNLNLYYFQCMEGLSLGDFLFEWERESQNQYLEQAVRSGEDFNVARGQIWEREFLKIGEILAAFADSAGEYPNILVIDEIDKLPERNEDMLLQILARYYAHIPRLEPNSKIGLPKDAPVPVILLTSNNLRSGVSAPLRSRCLYTFIESATSDEEFNILHAQVKNANTELISQLVRLLLYIRKMPSVSEANKPALREAIGLAKSLTKKGINALSLEVFESHLTHLARSDKDRHSLLAAKYSAVKFALNEYQN